MATDAEIVQGIASPGRYDAAVGSEAEARRLLQTAMPDAVELPPAIAGQPYPAPPSACKKWFQLHPAEPSVGHDLPHFKYVDWAGGNKGASGSWGLLEFPSEDQATYNS